MQHPHNLAHLWALFGRMISDTLKRMRSAVRVCLLLLTGVSLVPATPLMNTTGLASPGVTVTFNELVLPTYASMTEQYLFRGLRFSPQLFYDGQDGPNPVDSMGNPLNGISGHYLSNNFPVSLVNPFSIQFVNIHNAAAFAVATDPASTTFTALLNGSVVESFTANTNFDRSTSYFFGFTGVAFNEIRVSSTSSGGVVIDNVQFAPEPGSGLLMGAGLIGILAIVRRRLT